MTPACKLLQSKNIAYSIHEYQHQAGSQQFGVEAVEKLGLDAKQTFKTLLLSDGKQHFVAVLPVAYQLNLKQAAQALAVKKLNLAERQEAERLTGYLVGGISPLAQKKSLKTIIDASALQFDKIYVSAGRRGLEMALAPQDLAQLLAAQFADIVDA
jgi:Cys-tRNA(Pro)/Cys-tRNA(Cys) deacylase